MRPVQVIHLKPTYPIKPNVSLSDFSASFGRLGIADCHSGTSDCSVSRRMCDLLIALLKLVFLVVGSLGNFG
jgi:hypothetical protein